MSRRVVIRPRAEADIDHYYLFIAENSADAAIRFLDAVQTTFRAIADHPDAGAPRDFDHPSLARTRSVPVVGFPNHLVFYGATDNGDVLVIRLLHAAMDYEALIDAEDAG